MSFYLSHNLNSLSVFSKTKRGGGRDNSHFAGLNRLRSYLIDNLIDYADGSVLAGVFCVHPWRKCISTYLHQREFYYTQQALISVHPFRKYVSAFSDMDVHGYEIGCSATGVEIKSKSALYSHRLSGFQKIIWIILVSLLGLNPQKIRPNLVQLIIFKLLNMPFVSSALRFGEELFSKDTQMEMRRKWECGAEDVFQYAESGCICAIESNKFIKNVLVLEDGVIFEANRINMKYINV